MVSGVPGSEDDGLAEARKRAFRKLDEWLTWIYVLDDESVFSSERTTEGPATYRFALEDVISEPVDALRYSLKTTSLLF